MADEYRHDCLGVEGHPIVKTQKLRQAASEGVRLLSRGRIAVCSASRPHSYGLSKYTA